MIYFFIYIFAISFQVSGALLLLFYGFSTNRDNIICRFVGKGIITQENGNKISYNKEAYKQEYKISYLTKLSFFYIAIGYLIGVWGDLAEKCRSAAFILIIVNTTLIIFLSNIAVTFIVNKSKKIKKEITNEDFKRLKIEPDIGIICTEEIGHAFRDT